MLAARQCSGSALSGHEGDVGDDGRIWMEPGCVGTKGLVSQWPQDRTKGRSRSQIMEWMLVTDEILVAHYCEREYIVTFFVAEMFDWMAL